MEERDAEINNSLARQLAAQLLDHTNFKDERYYELEDAFTEDIRDFLNDHGWDLGPDAEKKGGETI